MQSVHSIWSGRTFAVASSGGDKKPRSRRLSKEERKTMVESFITKYQNLNNGKFPSLNLTHKEVGGSFYTVREIVREVIQQNRVLGPGHATSKVLNLEYFPEEQTEEPFSMDISTPLSISTINHAIDQQKGENFSLHTESRRTNPEIIKVDEPVNQEYHESQPDVSFFSQNLDGENYHEISNDAYLYNKSEDLSRKPNLDRLSGVTDGHSSICEQPHVDVQIYSSKNSAKCEHSRPSCEAVSLTRSLSESVVNGHDNGDRSTSEAMVINLSATRSSLSVTDNFSETNSSLDPGSTCSSLCVGENSPVGSTDAKSCNSGEAQNILGVATSFEVPEPSDSNEGRVAFVPFETDSVLNMSETLETLASCAVDEVSAVYPHRQLSLEKDSIINGSDSIKTLSSIAVDETSVESLSGSTSQNLDSPALSRTSPVALPLVQANEFGNGATNIEISSGESIQAIKPEPEPEPEPAPAATNIESSSGESIQANEPDHGHAITNVESSSGESIQAINSEPAATYIESSSGESIQAIEPDHGHAITNIESSSGESIQAIKPKPEPEPEPEPATTNIESSSGESIQAIEPDYGHAITNTESYSGESIQATKPEPATTNIESSSGESVQAIEPDHGNAITNIESTYVESIQATRPEPELAHGTIGSGKNSSRISQDEVSKETEVSEGNPFWAAIKSLLNAVVKFWME